MGLGPGLPGWGYFRLHVVFFQVARLRAQCDASCFLRTAGPQLPGFQLSRGPEGVSKSYSRWVPALRPSVQALLSCNPRETPGSTRYCALLFDRGAAEAETGSMASMWQSGGQAHTILICNEVLPRPDYEPPQVNVANPRLPEAAHSPVVPCRSFWWTRASYLLLDPGRPLALGEHVLLPRDGIFAIWRQGSCVTHSCVSSELFLMPAGFVSSRSNSSMSSPHRRMRAPVLQN